MPQTFQALLCILIVDFHQEHSRNLDITSRLGHQSHHPTQLELLPELQLSFSTKDIHSNPTVALIQDSSMKVTIARNSALFQKDQSEDQGMSSNP
jgi:hypothetical protein